MCKSGQQGDMGAGSAMEHAWHCLLVAPTHTEGERLSHCHTVTITVPLISGRLPTSFAAASPPSDSVTADNGSQTSSKAPATAASCNTAYHNQRFNSAATGRPGPASQTHETQPDMCETTIL